MSFFTKIIITLSLLLAAVTLYTYTRPSTSKVATLSSELGIQSSTTVTTGTKNTIDFTSPTGTSVKVRDFTHDAGVTIWYDPHTYVIGEGKMQESNAYQIFYFDTDKSINISLLSEPLGSVRLIAEDQLVKRLGLAPAEVCKLRINVGTPGFVSETYAGRNLGLSFCPGSVKLP